MKKIKNRLSFKLFYNDKFVMIFSVMVAFVAWFMVASTSTDAQSFKVSDIPISFPKLSGDLEYFGGTESKVEATISGNVLIASNVGKNDIEVVPSGTGFILSPGEYTLELSARKKSVKSDYSVTGISPSTVKVWVDSNVEKQMSITKRINVVTPDPYYVADMPLSIQHVTLSGPKTVLDKIVNVYAEYTADKPISETTTVQAVLRFRDSDDQEVTSEYLKTSLSSVTVPIYVKQKVTSLVSPNVVNVPETLGKNYQKYMVINPESIVVGVTDRSTVHPVSTESIDFSKVTKEKNSFTVPLVMESGWDNFNNQKEAVVSFDLSGLEEVTLRLNHFEFVDPSVSKGASVASDSIEVTIVGPKAKVEALKRMPSSSLPIRVMVDLSRKSADGSLVKCPVSFAYLDAAGNQYNECWIEGEHSVYVNLKDQTTVPVENSTP